MSIKAVWVVNADADGRIVTPLPGDEDALVKKRVDAMGANPSPPPSTGSTDPAEPSIGSSWTASSRARGRRTTGTSSRRPRGVPQGWILAGGLDPENVSDAIMTTRPTGVDVASGVTKEGAC